MLSINSAKAFNPASTAKLLTTWLALEELGPTYTWPTEAYLRGTLDRGILQGDLILKGYGDPYFLTERLWQFQQQLRLRGLRTIDGDLIIDNSYFADEHGDPSDFDGQGSRVYNVLPDALLINFQSVQVYLLPDKMRQTVRVVAEPMPANLTIENRLKSNNGSCWASIESVAVRSARSSGRDGHLPAELRRVFRPARSINGACLCIWSIPDSMGAKRRPDQWRYAVAHDRRFRQPVKYVCIGKRK